MEMEFGRESFFWFVDRDVGADYSFRFYSHCLSLFYIFVASFSASAVTEGVPGATCGIAIIDISEKKGGQL